MPVEEQVVSIFAGTRGYLDDLDVADVRRFEEGLLEDVRARYRGRARRHQDGKDLPEEELHKAVTEFKDRFVATRELDVAPAVDVA